MVGANIVAAANIITEADLLRLSAGDQWYEVVNGEVVPVSAAGFLHVQVVANVYDLLKPYIRQHRLGYILPDGLHCILSADAEGVRGSRIPNVAFIRRERIPPEYDFNRPFLGAPDLAVEVASPTENLDELLAKTRDYLAAGSEQVWVAYSYVKEVHQYRRDEPKIIRVYHEGDEIEAQSLFPGLAIPVKAFFELPD